MDTQQLIHGALEQPLSAIAYTVSRQLAAQYPDRAILEGDACSFDLQEFAGDGHCVVTPKPAIHAQVAANWLGPGHGLGRAPENAWFDVDWEGHSLSVLLLTWSTQMSQEARFWILAETQGVAEAFFQAACEWCAEVRGEVLVFESGVWHKSQELFQAIQDATFDNLILHGDLKQEIRADLEQFFASRAAYERYRIPWKRGILFVGPPGNGKTHTVKALINAMRQPCLYVKSFEAPSPYHSEHSSIRDLFQRARQTTPCIVVLEDLDALVTDANRSYFLNELDGFAANTGIVTLATTNHPERLDPAILERPSRFDRKYHFDLPGPAERAAYLGLWSDALEAELRLSESGIERLVALTEEFSFAYLKELFLSAMMQWISRPTAGEMQAIMEAQTETLREQMTRLDEAQDDEFAVDEGGGSRFPPGMAAMMRRHMQAARRGRG